MNYTPLVARDSDGKKISRQQRKQERHRAFEHNKALHSARKK